MALLLAIPALSQGPALPPGEYDLEAGQYVFNVPELAATDTPLPGATDTPVPPTDTPVPSGTTEPFASAPECLADANGDGHPDVTDSTYFAWNEAPDTRIWHDLWNEVDGCHYNHEHKQNPHDKDDIFGTEIYELAGGDISYPWAGGTNGSENFMWPAGKHQSYGWLYRGFNASRCAVGTRPYCVETFRLQYHATLGYAGASGRFHSFWLEAKVCNIDTNECGIVRTGGHQDFGFLTVDGVHVPLPGDPSLIDQGAARRNHRFARGNVFTATWYGDAKVGGISVIGETWGKINPNNTLDPILHCPDFQCQYNGSSIGPHIVSITLLPRHYTDGDGFGDFVGFSDRFGNIVPDCSLGVDCIPLKVEGALIEHYQYRDGQPGESDISPPGEFWISHPN